MKASAPVHGMHASGGFLQRAPMLRWNRPDTGRDAITIHGRDTGRRQVKASLASGVRLKGSQHNTGEGDARRWQKAKPDGRLRG